MLYPKRPRFGPALLLVLAASGCGNSPPMASHAAPDLSTLDSVWTGGVVGCDETPTWSHLGDDLAVSNVSCARFVGLDAVSDPEALLDALKASVQQAMPSAAVSGESCRTVVSEYPLAFRDCGVTFAFDDSEEAYVQLFAYFAADADGVAVLTERRDANSDLTPDDYEGVPLTAWVAVAWHISGEEPA